VRKTFNHFDKNGDGTLSKDELTKVLTSLHQNPTEEVLKRLCGSSGSIDFSEFLRSISNQPPPNKESEWGAFFNLLDIDGNGKVTSPELSSTLSALGYDLLDTDIENIFIEFDDNGDGFLTIQEVKDAWFRLGLGTIKV